MTAHCDCVRRRSLELCSCLGPIFEPCGRGPGVAGPPGRPGTTSCGGRHPGCDGPKKRKRGDHMAFMHVHVTHVAVWPVRRPFVRADFRAVRPGTRRSRAPWASGDGLELRPCSGRRWHPTNTKRFRFTLLHESIKGSAWAMPEIVLDVLHSTPLTRMANIPLGSVRCGRFLDVLPTLLQNPSHRSPTVRTRHSKNLHPHVV